MFAQCFAFYLFAILLLKKESHQDLIFGLSVRTKASHQKVVDEVCRYQGGKWICIHGLVCQCDFDQMRFPHPLARPQEWASFQKCHARFPTLFFRLEPSGGTKWPWFSQRIGGTDGKMLYKDGLTCDLVVGVKKPKRHLLLPCLESFHFSTCRTISFFKADV